MSEVHTTITGAKNEVTIVCHNPAQPPLAAGAGQAVVAAVKTLTNPDGTLGSPNGVVHGQVNAGGSVPGPTIHNPA